MAFATPKHSESTIERRELVVPGSLWVMDPSGTSDPLREARDAALERIDALRARAGAPEAPGPDLRTLLQRAETNVDELRGTARELAAILPTRVEAAVARALGEDEGGLGRQLGDVLGETLQNGSALDRVERDLLAERMARVDDLEVVVRLITSGVVSLRQEIAALAERVEGLQRTLERPLTLTLERPPDLPLAETAPSVRIGAQVESIARSPLHDS